jgi:hypothetical protein
MSDEKKPLDEKKKVAVLGALFVLVIGIGAFQFIGGSEPAPVAKKPEEKKTDAKSAEANKPKNPTVAFDLPARDPFDAPEPATPGAATSRAPEPTKIRQPRPEDLEPTRPIGITPLPGKLPMPEGNGQSTPPPAVREEPKFNYSVAGVMLGDVKLAVFKDAGGAQRLIREGGSLDGDTQVVSIEKGKVTVSFRGKRLELTNGGGSSAK